MTVSKDQLVKDRKKQMIEDQMMKFGKEKAGIHGNELPKYSVPHESDDQDSKKFWKLKKEYIDKPKNHSRIIMNQDRKYWVKNEMLIINNTTM